jgi:sugar/nucleoside kinase (ribokinase family)
MLLGGSSAICASWLAGLGAMVDFWGKVGSDALGDFVQRELRQRHIHASHVIQDAKIRTGACVALSYPSDRALISYMASIRCLRLEDLPLEQIGQFDHLHSGSIFIQDGLRNDFGELFRTAKEHGLTTSLDSGWDPAERWQVDMQGLLPYVDYFLPNEVEALHITHTDSIQEAAEALSQFCKAIVVKRGRDGAIARSGHQVWSAPAFEIKAVETTGAGDCFNAGLLYAIIEKGQTIPEALMFANGCGAIGASTPGGTSGSPSAAEVEHFIQAKKDINVSVVNYPEQKG